MLVKSDADAWSGRMQMTGQVHALTQLCAGMGTGGSAGVHTCMLELHANLGELLHTS